MQSFVIVSQQMSWTSVWTNLGTGNGIHSLLLCMLCMPLLELKLTNANQNFGYRWSSDCVTLDLANKLQLVRMLTCWNSPVSVVICCYARRHVIVVLVYLHIVRYNLTSRRHFLLKGKCTEACTTRGTLHAAVVSATASDPFSPLWQTLQSTQARLFV